MKKTIIVYSTLTILLLLTFNMFKKEPTPKQPIENFDTTQKISAFSNSILLDEVVVVGYRKKVIPDSVKIEIVNNK